MMPGPGSGEGGTGPQRRIAKVDSATARVMPTAPQRRESREAPTVAAGALVGSRLRLDVLVDVEKVVWVVSPLGLYQFLVVAFVIRLDPTLVVL